LAIIDLRDQLDVLAVEVRLNTVFEVKALGARYLGSDTQGFSGRARDPDGVFRALLHRETAEKRQIFLVRRTGETDPQAIHTGSSRASSRPRAAGAGRLRSRRSRLAEILE
jgi:hypothetical protein